MSTNRLLNLLLENVRERCIKELANLDTKLQDYVADDQTFDIALGSFLRRSDSRSAEVVKQKLSPYIDKTRSLAKVVQTAARDSLYDGLLWKMLYAALEYRQVILKSTDACDMVLEQVRLFESVVPNVEVAKVDYTSINPRLSTALVDVYGDHLDFSFALIHALSELSSSVLIAKFRGKAQFTKEARRKLSATAETATTHAGKLNEEIKTFLVASSEADDTSMRASSQDRALSSVPSSFPLSRSTTSATGPLDDRKPRMGHRQMVNLPRRNLEFVGRDDAFDLVLNYLDPGVDNAIASQSSLNESEPQICIIHGMGGVGKTQMASEYAYRKRSLYNWVFWVRSESSAEILKSFGQIGKKIGVLDSVNTLDQNALERVHDWFESTDQRWLLIFDNVEAWEDIELYWPQSTSSSSSVIITTQKPADILPWSQNVVQLLPFDERSGSDLILGRFKGGNITEEDKDIAVEITKLIGGLPLYLNQATGFMRMSQCTLAEYRDALHKTSTIPEHSTTDRNLGYDKPWNAALDVALGRLSWNALHLLYILAFLNPESVPESMIFADHHDSRLHFLRTDENKFEIVAHLRDGQLVKRDTVSGDPCLVTHRSIQHAILHKLNSDIEQRTNSFMMAFELLQAVLPKASALQQPEDHMWLVIEKYIPQIQSLEAAYKRAKPRMQGSLVVAEMFSRFGIDLYDRGLIKTGESLMRSAEQILETLPLDETIDLRANIHIVVGMYTDTLGITRRDEGLERRKKALELRRLALKGRSQVSINDDILLHNAVMDLSCSYQQFNRFDQVEKLSNQCVEKFRTWGKPEDYPYEYAKYYHSMAFLFIYRRQTDLAVRFGKAAADLMKQAGPGTLLTTVYRFDWAIFLFQAGKVGEAIQEHENILTIRLQICVKNNPLVLQSYLTLGIMSYFACNYNAAEEWIRKVLINQRKVYWPKENVARAKYYFSLVLEASKDAHPTITPGQPSNLSLTTTFSSAASREDHEDMPRSDIAVIFRNEANAVLEELLPDRSLMVPARSSDNLSKDAIFFDYMAPWGYRVVVEQIPDYLSLLSMCRSDV